MRDITSLPRDLFLVIIAYLPPRACIRCRAVSRRWFVAFTSPDISLLLLRWNFPRCREMRLVAAAAAVSSLPLSPPIVDSSTNLGVELECFIRETHSWPSTFADVARRYYHLGHARPRVVEKLELAGLDQDKPSVFSFRGVARWNRYLRLEQKTANFHYPDPSWWYSQEDGVLVYPAESRIDRDSQREPEAGYIYQVLDLSTGTQVSVPFDVRQKHIRRVRLAQGVLVLEWAEALPYHQLNDREVVHRHFVTAFDVVRIPSELSGSSSDTRSSSQSGDIGWVWTVKLRSEWKLHFLGLPLNRSDRFFSAHTATHYAVYFWQPNRSLYQDDPIEQLAVWDISSPSPYRPSEDPTGDKKATDERAQSAPVGLWNGTHGANGTRSGKARVSVSSVPDESAYFTKTATGPRVIRRMAWRELGFYNLRQRATPQLRNLALDERNLYFVEEEHRWADGQHSSLSPPRVHLVRCTGIPVIPAPTSPTKPPATSNRRPSLSILHNSTTTSTPPTDGPVQGPIWVDACGTEGDVNMSFCRRSAASNGPGGALVSWSTPSRIQLGALNNVSAELIMGLLKSRRTATSDGWTATETTPQCVANSSEEALWSFVSHAQRWPGWAPCWRHEDFPCLTVAEMVDFAAGVRVTARHFFMMETISVHVRSTTLSVKGTRDVEGADLVNGEDESSLSLLAAQKKKCMSNGGGRSEEIQFDDDMWSELVQKGHIAGDERWILGEDEAGRVTIVRF